VNHCKCSELTALTLYIQTPPHREQGNQRAFCVVFWFRKPSVPCQISLSEVSGLEEAPELCHSGWHGLWESRRPTGEGDYEVVIDWRWVVLLGFLGPLVTTREDTGFPVGNDNISLKDFRFSLSWKLDYRLISHIIHSALSKTLLILSNGYYKINSSSSKNNKSNSFIFLLWSS
jgi:hypothetical protein